MRLVKEEELGKLYTIEELYGLGVRPGDIVAGQGGKLDCGICWDYNLIRNGWPEEFNTALVAYKNPKEPTTMFPSELGYHWAGKMDSLQFRLVCKEEVEEFVNAWIEALRHPDNTDDSDFLGWGLDHYCQIMHALVKWGLINEYQTKKLKAELKKIYGVDLIKEYRKRYNW